MKKHLKYIVAFELLVFIAVLGTQCTKTIEDTSKNPFNQSAEPNDTAVVSLKNLEGLHQNIFAVKCANPTCHDGSFEPDFRTVQSTYASLVYHPVTKNDDLGTYRYRVFPNEVDSSWLYRRITGDEVLGRMPLYAEPLTMEEVEAIKAWINAGAKDIYDNPAKEPNLAPVIAGFALFSNSFQRLDTLREDGFASPFLVSTNISGLLAIGLTDVESDLADFNSAQVSFSYFKDQWQPFKTLALNKLSDDAMTASFVSNQFLTDTLIYFRAEVEDGGGAQTTFPNKNSPFYWKEAFSFRVNP